MENREFYIDHDGIPLHAKLDFPEGMEEGGKCPLVVVEHGFTGHMEEPHIIGISQAINKAGFATFRIETYGHGMSGGTFRSHTIFKWVSEMLTVIEYASKLDFVTNLYLTGHSQGGLTTVLVGGMNADRLKARQEILATRPEDIRALADLVDACMQEQAFCVFGSEEKVEAAKDIFGSVEPVA